MDQRPDAEITEEQAATDTPVIEEASAEYLGRWNRLVSTTNWEKGRIISQWREALIEAAHNAVYEPAREDGTPVKMWYQMAVLFQP